MANNNSDKPQQPQKIEIVPEPLPDDYVGEAEKIVCCIANSTPKMKWDRIQKKMVPEVGTVDTEKIISTSKLRNLFSLISEIYNVEILRKNEEEFLLPESVTALQKARIRFAYEAGRDEKTVKPFLEKTNLQKYVKWVGQEKQREELIKLFHYMEALVAYHRFFIGGKER